MDYRRMEAVLVAENARYSGTGGISEGNRSRGSVPGFLDSEAGAIYRSCDTYRRPAPNCLVEAWTPAGRVAQAKRSIVSEFLLVDRFRARSEAATLGDTVHRSMKTHLSSFLVAIALAGFTCVTALAFVWVPEGWYYLSLYNDPRPLITNDTGPTGEPAEWASGWQ